MIIVMPVNMFKTLPKNLNGRIRKLQRLKHFFACVQQFMHTTIRHVQSNIKTQNIEKAYNSL